MVKRWKQRRHFRKYGGKTILVNPSVIKKGVRISADKKMVFNDLAKRPTETGGYLDFNKKDLENVNMYFGSENELPVPDSDYEVEWHTHPHSMKYLDHKDWPSDTDIEDFLFEGKNQQAMIIFHKDHALSATKTARSKSYLKKPKAEIKADLSGYKKKLYKSMETKNFSPLLSDLKNKFGFEVRAYKPSEDMNIPIKVKENRGKENRRKGSSQDIDYDELARSLGGGYANAMKGIARWENTKPKKIKQLKLNET